MHQEWHMDQLEHSANKPLYAVGRELVVGFDDTGEEPTWGTVYVPPDFDKITVYWQWPYYAPDIPQGAVVMDIDFGELPRDGSIQSIPYATARVVLVNIVRGPVWYGGCGFTYKEIGLRSGSHRFWLTRAIEDERDTMADDFQVSGFRMEFTT